MIDVELTDKLNDLCSTAQALLADDAINEVTFTIDLDDGDEETVTVTAYRCGSCDQRHVIVTAEGPSTAYSWSEGEIELREEDA